MIFYATKLTIERFKIKMPEEMHPNPQSEANSVILKEQGDPLLEWGLKMFYFDRRKCIQVMNFASKLTIFLIDVKMNDFDHIANAIALYLSDLYQTDKALIKQLEKLFASSPRCAYSRLTNRSIISTLNRVQMEFAQDGYAFYEYFEKGVLQTKKINHDVNFRWLASQTIDGKTNYIYPGEKFRDLLLERAQRS